MTRADSSPLVSVVIPTYNRANYLKLAIQSVIATNYPSLQIIVVDDGSTDHTRETVLDLNAPVDYVYQHNAGLAEARNQGLRRSKGKYVCFLDSDDCVYQDKFDIQIDVLERETSIGALYSRWDYIDFNGNLLAAEDGFDFTNDLLKALVISNFAPIHAYLFKRVELTKVGGFEITLDGFGYEDWDLLLRLASNKVLFGFVPNVTVSYRMHLANMCLVDAEEMCKCGLDVIRRFSICDISKTIPQDILAMARGLVHIETSSQLYRLGQIELSGEYLRRAITYDHDILSRPLFFNYLVSYLSPPELGYAANALNHIPNSKIIEFYQWVFANCIEPYITPNKKRPHFSLNELKEWLNS